MSAPSARWHRLTREQHRAAFLCTDEYDEAFQFRDWDTVSRLQDECAAAWEKGPALVMPVAPDMPPSKTLTPDERASVVRKACTGLRLPIRFRKSDYRPGADA